MDLSFEKIFGPGEFNEEEKSYSRVFPSVHAGEPRNVLSFEVLKEHLERRNDDADPELTGNSKGYTLNKGNYTVEIQNFSDGKTRLDIDFSDNIEHIEPYMRNSIDQWLGEIIRREQKAYRAATRYVHQVLPEMAEGDESEILENELNNLGESFSDFHDFYRRGWPGSISDNYRGEFELTPFEKEMKKSELPGKMSQMDELENQDLVPRNDLYQRLYLDSIVKEAEKEYGISDTLKEKWLEYTDSGFKQSRRAAR